MRTVARLAVVLCLLSLVVALVGCGGSSPGVDSVAKKPLPPPDPDLDPVGAATGTIYYFDNSIGKICALDVASGGVTVLAQLSVTGSFDVSHADPVFFLYDDGENVYRQSIAGEAPQLLTVPLAISGLTPPRLSPNDSKVAFGAYVGTLVGNEVQGIYRVFEHTGIGTLGGTAWSPNGDRIAFPIRGSELGPDGYYHYDIAFANDAPWQSNTPPTLLTDTPADDELAPSWSADGTIAFSKTVRLRKGKLVGQDLYTIEPVAGATPSRAVSSTSTGQEFHFVPTWAPALDSAGLWELGFRAGSEQGAPTMLMRSAADGSTTAAALTDPTYGSWVYWRP